MYKQPNTEREINTFCLILPTVVVVSKQQLKSSNWEIKDQACSCLYACTLCVCATANQVEQRWSDFCLESQSRKEIKEQLNSTTALGPSQTTASRRLLSFLLDWLPSLPYQSIYFFFPSPCNLSFIHPSLSWDCRRQGRTWAQWAKRDRDGGFTKPNCWKSIK